jgi:hypothetical protein
MPDLGTIAPPYRIGPWIGASTWLPNAKLAFVENLSRGTSKIQSNGPTFQNTSALIPAKIFGVFLGWTWYSDNRG